MKKLFILAGVLFLCSFTVPKKFYPCHPNGDIYPCSHAMHPNGDLGPCTHYDVYGRTIHVNDIYPCTHPMHPAGDLGPCTHVCW